MNPKIDNTTVVAIIGSFAVIGAALITAYAGSNLRDWYLNIAFIILLIQTSAVSYVILSITGFFEWLSRIKQEKQENKLVKKFFNEFKHHNYVDKFYLIQSKEGDDKPFQYHTFHNVIDQLRQHDDFREFQKPNLKPIRTHFNFWRLWYNRFNGKDKFVFEQLLEDFGVIVNEYYRESVSIPLENIKNITQRAKEKNKSHLEIKNSLKEDWRIAMGHYDDFEKDYNDFVTRVNKAFNRNILKGIPVAANLV